MSGEGRDGRDTGAPRAWGTWESAATTVLFSVPALVLFWRVRDPGGEVHLPAFDAADWLGVGAALAGGLALSVAAGGVRIARIYVTTGLSSCMVWLLIGWIRPAGGALAEAYRPLVLAALLAHFNLLPLALAGALSAALRRRAVGSPPGQQAPAPCPPGGHESPERLPEAPSRPGLPAELVPRLRLMIWAVGAAALALDLSPVVWLIAPLGARRAATAGWAGACIAAGGTLAALVAARIASAGQSCPAGDASDGS